MTGKIYTSYIEFHRNYVISDESQAYIDSIIQYVSQLNSAIKLQHRTNYVLINEEEFDVNENVKCKLLNSSDVSITIALYSYKLKLKELREWIDNIYEIYKMDLQIGQNRYYFNHINVVPENYNNEPHLSFSMNIFETNKNFSNLFGENIDYVKRRVTKFVNDKDWYKKMGIPYTLGLLLHGLPGCGKTSLIKAISKETNRHILNIKLTDRTTLTQLRNLFYSDKIKVISEDSSPAKYISIPISHRIYVLEDVDCLSALLSRKKKNNNNDAGDNNDTDIDDIEYSYLSEDDKKNIKILGKQRWVDLTRLSTDKITLSDVLNTFDGVLESPGRILIMTTNYPEKLDEALLRPGRVDITIKFQECSALQIKQIFEHFYGKEFNFDYSSIEGKYTPAYVQEILLRYLDDPRQAFNILYNN